MARSGGVLEDIWCLVDLFEPHCDDRTTLTVLKDMLDERHRWHETHALFQEIRKKTLKAEKSNDGQSLCQYLFEEICAKTIYNLSGASAPFDSDSPYWVLPTAFRLARSLGIPDAEVIRVTLGSGPRA